MKKRQVFALQSSRFVAFMSVAVLSCAAILPGLLSGKANAAPDIPTNRKITMSSSAAGASKVVYTLSFTTAQSAAASNIGGMVIEFCDNTPILGDSCTSAATAHAFDTKAGGGSGGTLVLANQSGITGWTKDNSSTNTKIVLTRGVTSIGTGVTASIDLGDGASLATSILNPNVGNHTFYARILTFATGAGATSYTSGTPGTYVDGGGIAISTTNQLLITAKVQERLTFCMYDSGGSCTADTAFPGQLAITLGSDKGVLDPAGPYVDKHAAFDIQTNATGGAAIVMKGDAPSIAGAAPYIANTAASGMGATAGTAYTSTAGSEQFGFCIATSGASGLTINAPYNDATCSAQTTQTANLSGGTGGAGTATFGFNRTAAAGATGDTIATKTAGATSKGVLSFVGNISNTTKAGIYQTTLTYIATGTY